jgi:hypothetical protein
MNSQKVQGGSTIFWSRLNLSQPSGDHAAKTFDKGRSQEWPACINLLGPSVIMHEDAWVAHCHQRMLENSEKFRTSSQEVQSKQTKMDCRRAWDKILQGKDRNHSSSCYCTDQHTRFGRLVAFGTVSSSDLFKIRIPVRLSKQNHALPPSLTNVRMVQWITFTLSIDCKR